MTEKEELTKAYRDAMRERKQLLSEVNSAKGFDNVIATVKFNAAGEIATIAAKKLGELVAAED